MPRFHLFEIHEQSWCPKSIRDTATDFLQWLTVTFGTYNNVVPVLQRACKRTGTKRIIDLCSGAGGPWKVLLPRLNAQNDSDIKVLLTDRHLHRQAWQHLHRITGSMIEFYDQPYDITSGGQDLAGLHTMFTSFHHFRPPEAKQILSRIAARGQGVAIFEQTSRRILHLLFIFLLPIVAIAVMPCIRPFNWQRLFWTYLVPIAPVVIFYDGIISCLRTYSPAELQNLAEEIHADSYRWEVGQVRMPMLPLRVSYMLGFPERSEIHPSISTIN